MGSSALCFRVPEEASTTSIPPLYSVCVDGKVDRLGRGSTCAADVESVCSKCYPNSPCDGSGGGGDDGGNSGGDPPGPPGPDGAGGGDGDAPGASEATGTARVGFVAVVTLLSAAI